MPLGHLAEESEVVLMKLLKPIGTLKISSSLEGLKRPSYRIFARSRCIWISFLNWNLRISGFCHASARLGKAMLYSKVCRFVGCLLSFSERLKGCLLFICNWVGRSEPALILSHMMRSPFLHSKSMFPLLSDWKVSRDDSSTPALASNRKVGSHCASFEHSV